MFDVSIIDIQDVLSSNGKKFIYCCKSCILSALSILCQINEFACTSHLNEIHSILNHKFSYVNDYNRYNAAGIR